MNDSPRPVATDTSGQTIPDARVEAAMDAFYPGEDWRVALGIALPNSLRDMRAAIAAADATRPAPDGDAGLRETLRAGAANPDVGAVERLWDALELVLPMAKGYAAAHPVGGNARKIEHAEAVLETSAPQVEGAVKALASASRAALDRTASPSVSVEETTEDELKTAEEAVMAEWSVMRQQLRAPHIDWPVSPTNWRILRAGWNAIARSR